MLKVDQHSSEWRLITEYAQERIKALSFLCTRVNTDAMERERCAARIQELEQLLEAPRVAPIESGFTGETY